MFNRDAPLNTNLPDPPKAVDWIRHRAGLIPGLLGVAIVIAVAATLPSYLHRLQADDLRGVPETTSAGVVTYLLDDPGHPGGGGPFNAVVLRFDGHKAFWDLPPTSKWKPMIGEVVEVHYRVDNSGNVYVSRTHRH